VSPEESLFHQCLGIGHDCFSPGTVGKFDKRFCSQHQVTAIQQPEVLLFLKEEGK
jgi:hypothetical protein